MQNNELNLRCKEQPFVPKDLYYNNFEKKWNQIIKRLKRKIQE